MSFCFGLRPPKAVSALRDFNARGRQSRPCAKVFTCGENACTAHSRRRPEGRVGAVLSACREFENIQIVVTSQKKRTSEGLSPIGTQCEPMGLKPYMGKERFCGTDTTKSLLIYQRTAPCRDKECLEVSPDSQHNSGIVILVGKAFLLNQSMHRLNRFLCSAFIKQFVNSSWERARYTPSLTSRIWSPGSRETGSSFHSIDLGKPHPI